MYTVRYASPEIEAAILAKRAEHREQKRRGRLEQVVNTYARAQCHHGRDGWHCMSCTVDFFLAGLHVQALAEIDAAMAAEAAAITFQVTLGQHWHLPVGPAAHARIMEVARDERIYEWRIPALEPLEPLFDCMMVGSRLLPPSEAERARGVIHGNPSHALMTPINEIEQRSYGQPHVLVPIEYLCTYGVRLG